MSTDLKYLEEMTGGNQGIMKEMIEMFLKQLEDTSVELDTLYAGANWLELSRLAHKVKSSALVMGAKVLADTMIAMETAAKDDKLPAGCKLYIDDFHLQSADVSKELQEFLKNNI